MLRVFSPPVQVRVQVQVERETEGGGCFMAPSPSFEEA